MDLWAKTFLIITLAVTAGLAGIFTVAGIVIVQDYAELEAQAAAQDMELVERAIHEDALVLEGTTLQLADLSSALFGGNVTTDPNVTSQLFASVFLQNGVDVVYAVFNGTSFGILFDRSSLDFPPVPESMNETLRGSALLSVPDNEVRSGIVTTPNGTFLMAARSVSLGLAGFDQTTLAVGRQLDAGFALALSGSTQENVTLVPYADAPDHPAWAEGLHLDRPDLGPMTISLPLTDVDGGPAMLLQVTQERTVFRQGIDTLTFFFGASLAIAVVFLVVGLGLMRFTVTGRVRRLSHAMHDMQTAGSGERVELRGKDEVGRLASEFNGLMDRLDGYTARLHESNESLQRSNEDLETFARVVTHDLKSPLSTFALNLQMLKGKAEKEGDAKSLERVARMQRSTESMAERIDAILAYSRSRATAAPEQAVRMEEVMNGVLADLTADIEAHGAQVHVGTLPPIHTDPRLLAQILQNLVSNGIKYHKDGEPATVRVVGEDLPDEWRIHVDDQGVGFGDEDAKRLFRPFERLPGTEDRPGHGVGLASCARIAERLGGRLEAHGQPGVGARFTLVLPKPSAT